MAKSKRNPTRKEIGNGLIGAGLAIGGLALLCKMARKPRKYSQVGGPFGEVKRRKGEPAYGGEGY